MCSPWRTVRQYESVALGHSMSDRELRPRAVLLVTVNDRLKRFVIIIPPYDITVSGVPRNIAEIYVGIRRPNGIIKIKAEVAYVIRRAGNSIHRKMIHHDPGAKNGGKNSPGPWLDSQPTPDPSLDRRRSQHSTGAQRPAIEHMYYTASLWRKSATLQLQRFSWNWGSSKAPSPDRGGGPRVVARLTSWARPSGPDQSPATTRTHHPPSPGLRSSSARRRQQYDQK